MNLARFFTSSIFQIISILFVFGYLLGMLNIHFSDKNEYCAMTYMFEYPQFVRVSVPENTIYSQYGLYAYSEGRLTERARKMWFDGVPVLFLPGNSGSHMQARSLASVALRMALNGPKEYHFDYFTIDYNEELSGLYGGVLQSQTQFAAAAISRILNLYKRNKYTKTVPTTVILVGHSMGGVIAKRLLAYPSTLNSTSIALTLAAPIEAPTINFDNMINDYYMLMKNDWDNLSEETRQKKVLISLGNGPRDILVASALTSSQDSHINALTTAIPGVWVSPNHVGIVWCKQLVMVINRYLFDVVDLRTKQITEDMQVVKNKATQYFQANRSMTLSPEKVRTNVMMIPDAFWYEDNRRIYQIARPEIDKTIYLMIRLVNYPQNRFVAVEAVNVTDRDWLFGCNAMYVYNTYRYCKQATSLTELSRWSGAAAEFGRRKLATIDLHSVKQMHPEWTHVVVKVSPTRKSIILNVDINDYASRQVSVDLPSVLSLGTTVIKQETEPYSIYYELILPGFNAIYQAYLLHVEPTGGCKAIQYHVSAELHVPWAANNEYYHFFTQSKRSPMKLRLYKSNPNVTYGQDVTDHAKVTLLLDPQCTYTISISSTWYHRLAQIARNYSPVLMPYAAAVLLLATRSNILSLKESGRCMSMHGALMSEGVKPYYVLVFARFGFMTITSVPIVSYVLETASWSNVELVQFSRSLLVVPAYMTALGILHLAVAAVLAVMVFSSQLAHRMFFRLVWRGGGGGGGSLTERVASGLQRAPAVVMVVLVGGVPLSCGAASLVAGAAFYAFLLSKMYEEYLEDYVYKIAAKAAAMFCRFFTKKPSRSSSETTLLLREDLNKESQELKAIADKNESEKQTKGDNEETNEDEMKEKENTDSKNEQAGERGVQVPDNNQENTRNPNARRKSEGVDDDLNNLNFHLMMFCLWVFVTLCNVPALLTWARNFKYSMVLKPDTSYHTGLTMSICSACLWQMSGPRKNLKHYDMVAVLLFSTAVVILVLGPFSLSLVNYCITIMYTVITFQQIFDKPENNINDNDSPSNSDNKDSNTETNKSDTTNDSSKPPKDSSYAQDGSSNAQTDSNRAQNDLGESSTTNNDNRGGVEESSDCACNENRIYTMFKNLREKFDFSEIDS